ncbi:Predicted glutamine amidotransferase [Ferrithrix thermotolerans DSM 19514]|uniref:Predicted glutamine amidotransferase n=1 Tax=Ferrithrix thermotolerans DSM 19514 TaxID=1121881 RepID=A0A1M4S4M1_9ACTN|nr:class II glutamine amidotransferase [Ferrithrix thermotolerans]SHE27148.1 Predicted glutamine amidotransferase [Ferrithrix thermotolerans DSM 19514]
MCRLLGYVADPPTTVPDLLGEYYASFEQLSGAKHRDGWGLAYLKDEEIKVVKAPTCAEEDPLYKEAVKMTKASAALLHYRWATLDLKVTASNTHPFLAQDMAFIHNGSIYSPGIYPMVNPSCQSFREGDTDSEAYFLALCSSGLAEDPERAIGHTLGKIMSNLEYSSLNAMILSQEALYVICAFRSEYIPPDEDQEYYTLRYLATSEAVVVASSGWSGSNDWEELPNNSLLKVSVREMTAKVTPLSVL